MSEKPFGHDCTYERRTSMIMTEEVSFHGKCSERAIRTRARWKTGFVRIVKITPLSQEDYIRAFGVPGLRM